MPPADSSPARFVPVAGFHAWPQLTQPLADHGLTSFSAVMSFTGGTTVSRKRGRWTVRLDLDGQTFYLKRNRLHPVELLKNLRHLRLNGPSAVTEAANATALRQAGLPAVHVAAFGRRRWLGVDLQSFVLMPALDAHLPLQDLLHSPRLAAFPQRRAAIDSLAEFAGRMHALGFQHRDFYLSHIFRGPSGELVLIDVQRVRRRQPLPYRWRVKDLAQVYYSACIENHASRADALRFFRRYAQSTGRAASERTLACAVLAKARRIGRHTVKLLARRRRRGELPAQPPPT